MSIFRSRFIFLILGVLYTLSQIQLTIYNSMKQVKMTHFELFTFGYFLGIMGLIGSLLGIQYLVINSFRFEMGNLETLGFTRRKYIFLYYIQFCILYLLSAIPAFILIQIVYSAENVSGQIHNMLYGSFFNSFLWLGVVYLSFLGLCLIWISRKEPMILIREK